MHVLLYPIQQFRRYQITLLAVDLSGSWRKPHTEPEVHALNEYASSLVRSLYSS